MLYILNMWNNHESLENKMTCAKSQELKQLKVTMSAKMCSGCVPEKDCCFDWFKSYKICDNTTCGVNVWLPWPGKRRVGVQGDIIVNSLQFGFVKFGDVLILFSVVRWLEELHSSGINHLVLCTCSLTCIRTCFHSDTSNTNGGKYTDKL